MERTWTRFYDHWVPESINYPRVPLSALLDFAAAAKGDEPATIFFGATLSYRELKAQVEKMAAALYALGIRKGDRVGIQLPNCPQFVIAYYAAQRLGAIAIGINPQYMPRELAHVIHDAQLNVLFAFDRLAPVVNAAKAQYPVPHIIYTGVQDYMPEQMREPYLNSLRAQNQMPDIAEEANVYQFVALRDTNNPFPPKPDIDPLNDLAALQYTGGTTGTSKGAMLTHYNLISNATAAYYWSKGVLGESKRPFITLTIIPLYHSYGMTCCMNVNMLTGGALLLLPRFDIDQALATIKQYRPTYFPGAPTLYTALINHPKAEEMGVRDLVYCNSGSAPLPLEVLHKFAQTTNAIFTEGYGLSEASPVTHSNPAFGPKKPGTVGIPFPDTECRIVDLETGAREVAVGEAGELVIRGPQVMKGYWNRPDETASQLRDGWLYTGDIVSVDEDGYFTILERKKDMIIASGFNVYPGDVEDVLYSNPKVLEAAVIGIPDAYRGETVKAYVVLKPGEEATDKEIIAFCRENMAAFKAPTVVEFISTIPRTNVGKVLRTSLRQMHAESAKQPATA